MFKRVKELIVENLSGTTIWKYLLLASGYVFCIFLMVILAVRVFDALTPMLIGYFIWIAFAFTLMREQKIRNLEHYGGTKILTGPLDEEEDKGEITEFEIKEITRYYKLPTKLRASIIDLVIIEKGMIEEMDKRENIMYRLNRNKKQVSYTEIPKKEELPEEINNGSNVDNNEVDYEDDDIVEIDKEYVDDILRYPKENEIKTDKKDKFDGKKIPLKKKKKKKK